MIGFGQQTKCNSAVDCHDGVQAVFQKRQTDRQSPEVAKHLIDRAIVIGDVLLSGIHRRTVDGAAHLRSVPVVVPAFRAEETDSVYALRQ